MLALERDDSALLPGAFRLEVMAPNEPQPVEQVVNGAFALLGRAEGCTCQFDHPSVDRRHAYLQAIYGRMYCVDLSSGHKSLWTDSTRRGGWLDPDGVIRIGPFQVRLVDTLGLGSGSEAFSAGFNPLDRYAGEVGPLPRVEIQVRGGGRHASYTISRLMTLVGNSSACKLRLRDTSVSSIHCSLLWLRDGLWVIDLAGKAGTRVQGKAVRCAKLAEGEKLRIGQFLLRVHYPGDTVAGPVEPRKRHSSVAIPVPKGAGESDERSSGQSADMAEAALDQGGKRFGQSPERTPPSAANRETHRRHPRNLDLPAAPVEDEPARLVADFALPENETVPGNPQLNAPVEQQAAERPQPVETRETKLAEAQRRLAAEWDRLHDDRAALDSLNEALNRKQEELTAQARRQAEEAESLERQRRELASRAAELTESRKSLKAEWKKLDESRSKGADAKDRPATDRSSSKQSRQEPTSPAGAGAGAGGEMGADPISTYDLAPIEADVVDADEGEPAESDHDILESTRHNKVFSTERSGDTLVVIPLGDASEFHYGDVHTESNKVRRLLESGAFQNLVVDLGSDPVLSAVTINVVVALSRIASNRGGRAVLCTASEKTRSVLQSMKLLELWPLFTNRAEALRALSEPSN